MCPAFGCGARRWPLAIDPRLRWNALLLAPVDHLEQSLDAVAADAGDDAELGQVGADRVDQRRALPDEQLTRPVQHKHRLLVHCLDRHEAHRGPRHCFANRLGIGSVVLVALDVGLHIARRHQSHFVAELDQLACPMMGGRAGLHTNQARPDSSKELQDLAALQLSANDNLAGITDGMDLEHRLRDVQSDCANLLHGRLLSCGPQDTATWHIAMPAEEPSTASIADI